MSPSPRALHSHAEDDLRFIRDAMEGSTRFTAVSGLGEIAVGAVGLLAAYLAAREPTAGGWLTVWLGAAALACPLTLAATAWKARRMDAVLLSRPGRRFLLALVPPMVSAAFLTLVLFRAGWVDLLPGAWLLLYGAGVVTGGAFSIRVIPVMGCAFMLAGAATLLAFPVGPAAGGPAWSAPPPPGWADLVLAAGFGGLHLLFGTLVAWKHGG